MLTCVLILYMLTSARASFLSTPGIVSHGDYDSGLQNKVFPDYLGFEVSSRSFLDCARLCSRTDACLTFSVTSSASSKSLICRGYTEEMTSSSPSQNASSTRVFVLRKRKKNQGTWLNQVCETYASPILPNCTISGIQISGPGIQCYRGQCVCAPDYYHSVAFNDCAFGCKLQDLQPWAFMARYRRANITGHLLFPGTYNYTLDIKVCENFSAPIPQCLGTVFTWSNPTTGLCYLIDHSAVKWSPDFVYNEFRTFSVKQCY